MRFLYKDAADVFDITPKIESYKTGAYTMSYVTGQDNIYIGSDTPFNHFYVKLGTVVNLVPANMKIEYWDGLEWIEAVEVIDQTNGFFGSGFVEFTPDKANRWCFESTKYEGEEVEDLTSLVIYDLYWLRVSFDATLTPSIDLSWIGNLFCDDDDLYSEKPVFNSSTLLNHFQAGKTNWEEQRVRASELLIKDLKAQGIIVSAGQILRRQDYKMAAISKTAQVIFAGMGDDYKDDAISANNEYKDRLKTSIHIIDRNQDGIVDIPEKFARQGWLNR